MLLQRQSYIKALFLCSLFFIAGYFFNLATVCAGTGYTPSAEQHTIRSEKNNDNLGTYQTGADNYHKTPHVRLRVKFFKTYLKKIQDADARQYTAAVAAFGPYSSFLRSVGFKPGYYLFLFRLTPFWYDMNTCLRTGLSYFFLCLYHYQTVTCAAWSLCTFR